MKPSLFHPILICALLATGFTAPLNAQSETSVPTAPQDNDTLQDQSHGQVIHLYWKKEEIYDRNSQTVTLTGGARAVRNDVTLDADTLIGYLRHKAPPPGQPHAPKNSNDNPAGGAMELYRVEARGHVHIYNVQDQGWGDHGLYDVDKSVILMTGKHMKFTTPREIITARDLVEYYPDTHISIGRGNATVTSNDRRRITADVLETVGLSGTQQQADKTATPEEQKNNSGKKPENSKLDRAYGWGHVIIRTQSQTATGNRGVYLFGPQLARLIGQVHITQGQNQNNGSQAIVNMKTGIATMLPDGQSPIQGLVIPNEASN